MTAALPSHRILDLLRQRGAMLRPAIIEAVLSTNPPSPAEPPLLTVAPHTLGIAQRAPVGRIPPTVARVRGVPTRMSLKQTLDFVVRQEIKNPKTGNLFTMNGVFHILRNQAYTGKILWSKKIHQGIHEPIISKELFEHAQSRERIAT